MRSITCAVTIASLVFLSSTAALAASTTFTKKQVVKSGRVSCAVYKSKWQPVVKQGSKYALKKSPTSKDKTACKTLLVPTKAFSLDDVPNLTTLARSKASSSSAVSALAYSGEPPKLSDISTLGAENVFWRSNVVTDIATNTPASQASCQEFFGGSDGVSASFPGCFMAQGVAQSFQAMLSAGTSLCIMQNMPTQENVSSGGVIVTSGTPPSGNISKLFETPTGSDARLIKITTPAQQFFVKVASSATNASKSNQYAYEVFICGNGSLVAYESTRVTLGGTFRSTTQHPFGQGQSTSGKGQADVTASLVKTSAGIIFNTAADRTVEFTGVDGNTSTAASVTITADNIIKNKVRDTRQDGTNTVYNEARFQGSSVNALQFLEGAARGTFTHNQAGSRSFGGAAEYRDTYYASAPSNSLVANVNAIDFNTDPFYTKTLSVPDLPSFDCAQGGDIEISLNFSAPTMQTALSTCANHKVQSANFCQSNTVIAAQVHYPLACPL